MRRLALALGGQALTTAGLAGIGDLVLTCTGDLSRNRTLGFKLGKGTSLEEALSTSAGVAEGYLTAKSAFNLAKKVQVELPICESVYAVLYEGKQASEVLQGLLSRPLRPEQE
jgi:glycerol-3-phosphate dehydrogenase (NAD(P)+)